jgi:hypothetical protein
MRVALLAAFTIAGVLALPFAPSATASSTCEPVGPGGQVCAGSDSVCRLNSLGEPTACVTVSTPSLVPLSTYVGVGVCTYKYPVPGGPTHDCYSVEIDGGVNYEHCATTPGDPTGPDSCNSVTVDSTGVTTCNNRNGDPETCIHHP